MSYVVVVLLWKRLVEEFLNIASFRMESVLHREKEIEGKDGYDEVLKSNYMCS